MSLWRGERAIAVEFGVGVVLCGTHVATMAIGSDDRSIGALWRESYRIMLRTQPEMWR